MQPNKSIGKQLTPVMTYAKGVTRHRLISLIVDEHVDSSSLDFILKNQSLVKKGLTRLRFMFSVTAHNVFEPGLT